MGMICVILGKRFIYSYYFELAALQMIDINKLAVVNAACICV